VGIDPKGFSEWLNGQIVLGLPMQPWAQALLLHSALMVAQYNETTDGVAQRRAGENIGNIVRR
jgi:hypothetical protein